MCQTAYHITIKHVLQATQNEHTINIFLIDFQAEAYNKSNLVLKQPKDVSEHLLFASKFQ